MSTKTRKQTKRQRRRTLRRKTRKGGLDSQAIIPSSSAFKNAAPLNSDNVWHKIA